MITQDFVALVDLMGAAAGDVLGGIVYGAGGPGLIDAEMKSITLRRSSLINVFTIACTEPGGRMRFTTISLHLTAIWT